MCLAAAAGLGSCAILSAASKAEAVFLREEDPRIAAESLPTFIKVSEILLESDPADQGKIVSTASLLVMYASAFVDGPASLLPDERFEERRAAAVRAGALYRRAFRLLAGALERRAPGSLALADASRSASAADEKDGAAAKALSRFGKGDVPLLYWSAASILAAFGLDPFDFESARHVNAAAAFMARAVALDPGWSEGAVYELLLPYYASMPEYLGGNAAKAEEAYAKALEYSRGGSASLFVAYATSICLPRGDARGFKAALERALAIDPGARPERRLPTALAQERARALLRQVDRYFILTEGERTP